MPIAVLSPMSWSTVRHSVSGRRLRRSRDALAAVGCHRHRGRHERTAAVSLAMQTDNDLLLGLVVGCLGAVLTVSAGAPQELEPARRR